MTTHLRSSVLAVLTAGLLGGASATAAPTCDKAAADVRAAVEAAPSRVLIIVEDAMIANEGCACEIVKAAILASNANPELSRQIALTASNVAPNLSKVISECARSVVAANTGGGKEVKQVIAVQPEAPMATGGSDYVRAPADIRGVYLISNGGGGIVIQKDGECDKIKRTPPKDGEPQSPSQACPKP
ncbi:hypothetical protein DES53_111200 [Roseimicrobium gellanilyticum]|uniref:Uncharacterized protein n=1 Tax=Roseimicrobium gellanilyticum TaxID=748857 RepID=A0A366H8W9_9BACT|nr:hypothetical protein DES53_111200 [Roseimicrobium gellanilyticum]